MADQWQLCIVQRNSVQAFTPDGYEVFKPTKFVEKYSSGNQFDPVTHFDVIQTLLKNEWEPISFTTLNNQQAYMFRKKN